MIKVHLSIFFISKFISFNQTQHTIQMYKLKDHTFFQTKPLKKISCK